MNVFEILSMVGGIALFLYGMKLMGDSLSDGRYGLCLIIAVIGALLTITLISVTA